MDNIDLFSIGLIFLPIFRIIDEGESKSNTLFFSIRIIINTITCINHSSKWSWFSVITSLHLNIVSVSLISNVTPSNENMYPWLVKLCWLFCNLLYPSCFHFLVTVLYSHINHKRYTYKKNTGGLKYTGNSVVQVRTFINFLTSEFGSSTRGERDTQFLNLSILTKLKRSAHLVVFKIFVGRDLQNSMVRLQLLNVMVITSTLDMAKVNSQLDWPQSSTQLDWPTVKFNWTGLQ